MRKKLIGPDPKDSFQNSVKNGPFETYYETGQLKSKSFFIDGVKDGVTKTYHSNGQLKSKSFFKYGNKVGLWEIYREDGELVERKSFKDGVPEIERQTVILKYPNGQFQRKESYKSGVKDGLWESYHKNG